MRQIAICTHIKVTGIRCGSPALREQEYCYFHQRMIRGIKGPRSRLSQIALLESAEAIQVSIMEVVNALVSGTIEVKRGELVLRALNTAVRNSRRVYFGNDSKMIRELPPEEPEPERVADPVAVYKAGLEAAAAASTTTQAATAASGPSTGATAARVGTDAVVRPRGPAVPVRSIENGARKPPVGVKKVAAPAKRKRAASS